jgi:hypothetical protein
MNVIQRFATSEPTVCAVCRRRAVWLGYAPPCAPVVWLCDDAGCHAAAEEVYSMTSSELDEHETAAMLEGGEQAGSYLDEIGETDLARLSREQWLELLRRLLTGYEHALRNGTPPNNMTREDRIAGIMAAIEAAGLRVRDFYLTQPPEPTPATAASRARKRHITQIARRMARYGVTVHDLPTPARAVGRA